MLDNREEYIRQVKEYYPNKNDAEPHKIEGDFVLRCQKCDLAYICIYGSNYVAVVDIKEGIKIYEIEVGAGPQNIDINRVSYYGYVTNFWSNSVSMIDLRLYKTVKTVDVGINPAGIKLSRDGRHVYIAHYGQPVMYVLDAATLEKVTEIPLPSNGFEIDITQDGNLAFVTLRSVGQIAVIDLSVNLAVKILPAGAGTEFVRISPSDPIAIISNEDGNTLTAVNTQLAESAFPDIPTAEMPVGIAFTRCGSRMYIANRGDNSVSEFDVFKRSEIAKIPVGQGPYGVEAACCEQLLIVSNSYEDTVSIIDTLTNEVISTVTVGFLPSFMAVL